MREGRKTVQFLIDQKPLQQNITMVPWNKLIQSAVFGATGAALCEKGKRLSQWGVGVNQLDARTYLKVASMFQEMIKNYPASIGSAVTVQLLSTQAVLAVPNNATAYPWRKHIAHVYVLSFLVAFASYNGGWFRHTD